MAFTKQQISEQEQAVERLVDELSQLSSQFDVFLKAQGVTKEFIAGTDLDNPPPELKEQLDAARAAAKRAGEERKGRAQWETKTPKGAVHPGNRPGAIRL
jgi:cytochrome P450